MMDMLYSEASCFVFFTQVYESDLPDVWVFLRINFSSDILSMANDKICLTFLKFGGFV